MPVDESRSDRFRLTAVVQLNKANGCSEGADALRQWAQAKDAGILGDIAYTTTRQAVGDANSSTNRQHGYKEAPPPDWRF